MSDIREMRRRDARILALSALFCWDVAKDDPASAFEQVVEGYFEGSARYDYAKELFFTATAHAGEIDGMIAKASQGWPLARMPRVDLSVLRMAVAEAHFLRKAPYEVVIDEALELSKEFSTHASPRFVNGVLMGIFREIGHAKRSPE